MSENKPDDASGRGLLARIGAVGGFLTLALGMAGNDADRRRRKETARKMVREVLEAWDWTTWDNILDENVVLILSLGAAGSRPDGKTALTGYKEEIRGREDAKHALKGHFGDLRKNLKIQGQLAEGYESVSWGDLVVQDDPPQNLPFLSYVRFNKNGRVDLMTVSSVDLRSLGMVAPSIS